MLLQQAKSLASDTSARQLGAVVATLLAQRGSEQTNFEPLLRKGDKYAKKKNVPAAHHHKQSSWTPRITTSTDRWKFKTKQIVLQAVRAARCSSKQAGETVAACKEDLFEQRHWTALLAATIKGILYRRAGS